MLGSVISRFRVAMLLSAFALGLAGQILSNAAMAAPMQPAARPSMTSGALCPDCTGDQQHRGMAAGCVAAPCWPVPALPAHSTIPEPLPRVAFAASPDVIAAGIASAPDPHPPRFFLPA